MKTEKGIQTLDSPSEYDQLSSVEKRALAEWIRLTIQPATKPHSMSSYGLKHMAERDMRTYISNGQMKGALLAASLLPVDPDELNWHFCIKPARKMTAAEREQQNRHCDFYLPEDPGESAELFRLLDLARQKTAA
jgi:hypothetical protein